MAQNWRRGSSKNQGVTASNALSRHLWSRYAELGTWDRVGAEIGVTKAMAFRVAKGYEPKAAGVRQKLGLPAQALGIVCPVHGVVHSRQCRAKGESKPRVNWKKRALAAEKRLAELNEILARGGPGVLGP